MRRIVKLFILLLLTWMLVHVAVTVVVGLSDKGEKADLAVIFGNKVNTEGTLSARLEKRMECGLQVYNAGRVKHILVSGGLGKEGFYEGDVMKQYLIAHHVPDNVIIVDNKGDNTLATVMNTRYLHDSLHVNSIIVVSQYYHILRAEKLYRRTGFRQVSGVSPRYFELRDLYSLLREFVAYYTE